MLFIQNGILNRGLNKCGEAYTSVYWYVYLSRWCTSTSVWLLVTELLLSPLLKDWKPCWDRGCLVLDEGCCGGWFLTTSGMGTLVREDGFACCCCWWSLENVSIDLLLRLLAIKAFLSAWEVGVRLCWSITNLSGGKSWDCASGKGWYLPVLPSSMCKPYRW